MVGAFKAKKKGNELTVSKFIGDQKARAIVREFANTNRVWIRDQPDRPDDWEIIEWYEKMYGKGGSS